MKQINTKIFMFTILLSIVFIFSGCNLIGGDAKTSGFGTSSSKSSGSSNGKEGVVLEFQPEYPPTKGYKDQAIGFAFNFKNYQKFDITDLKLKVSGYDSNYVVGDLNNYLGEGQDLGATIAKFSDDTGATPYAGLILDDIIVQNFQNTYNLNTKFDYCYSAKTTFSESTCIPSKDTNKCDTTFEKKQNQNGIVSITMAQPVNIGTKSENKVRIVFTLQNQGNGKLRQIDNCFKTREDITIPFNIDVKLGTNSPIECKSKGGSMNFVNNKATIYCDFDRGQNTDSYSSQITLTLDGYKYEQTVSKKINIVDINAGLD